MHSAACAADHEPDAHNAISPFLQEEPAEHVEQAAGAVSLKK